MSKFSSTIPSVLRINGVDYSGRTLASLFNAHFFTFRRSNVTLVPQKILRIIYVDTPTRIYISVTNQGDRSFDVIYSLKYIVAFGDDELKVKPIKAIANKISLPFSAICDKILGTGVFHPRLYIARVLMTHKAGPINNLNTYRPISVLPNISKVIETIKNSKLSHHLTLYNLLVKQRYGLEIGKSTEEALLNIKNKILTTSETMLYT